MQREFVKYKEFSQINKYIPWAPRQLSSSDMHNMAAAITGSSLRDFKKDLQANFEHKSFISAIRGLEGSLLTSLAIDLMHINANC